MTGTRFFLVVALGFVVSAPLTAWDGGGLFNRSKPKVEPARVRQLIEILRLDPDEKKRKAAVVELAEADPRNQLEVMPALVAALRKDASSAVRAAAAEAIGKYNVVFPTAGVALEEAMESDPSTVVRGVAKQVLWEYHLIGYRSPKAVGGFAGQTVEPPIARPARAPGPVTYEPPPAPAVVAAGAGSPPPFAPLPPVGPPPGPRVSLATRTADPVARLTGASLYPNLTVEPPFAKPSSATVSVPVATAEPPIRPRWTEPVSVGKPPPIASALPPIVADPGPIPGVTPFREPTAEPPIRKRASAPAVSTPTLSLPPGS